MDESRAVEVPAQGTVSVAGEETEETPGEPKKRRSPGRRYVYQRWCKGCGICVAFCPQHVFAIGEDGRAEAVQPEACSNCQLCDRLCPDFAITLTKWEDKYDDLFRPMSLGQDKAEGHHGAIH